MHARLIRSVLHWLRRTLHWSVDTHETRNTDDVDV
jgi:hypothetical protein